MTRRLAVLAMALVALVAGAIPALGDPALEALQQGSVYVSPVVGGTGTPDAQARLQEVADELARGGRPVRIVVVPGPVGAATIGIGLAPASGLVVSARSVSRRSFSRGVAL